MTSNNVEVILCSNRHPKIIINAVNKILEHCPSPRKVIIVVPKILSSLGVISGYKKVVIRRSDRANLSKQRNIGLKTATAEIVGFIDDDTVLEKNHIYEVLKAFKENPSLIGLGGCISNYGKAPLWLTKYRRMFLLSHPAPYGEVNPLPSGFFIWPDPANAPKLVKSLWGCCMWWRRSKIEDLQFDESLSAFEDVEFGFRAGSRGKLLLSDCAIAYHLRISSNRSDFIRGLRQIQEARIIGQRFPKHGFRTIFWLWASIGQAILVFASNITGVHRLLAPEYRKSTEIDPDDYNY